MICEKLIITYDAVGSCSNSGLSLTDLLLNHNQWWRIEGLSIYGWALLAFGLYKGYKWYKARKVFTKGAHNV